MSPRRRSSLGSYLDQGRVPHPGDVVWLTPTLGGNKTPLRGEVLAVSNIDNRGLGNAYVDVATSHGNRHVPISTVFDHRPRRVKVSDAMGETTVWGNPAPAAIIGTSILGGIGAGTGFAIANAATVPFVRRAESALKRNPRRSHSEETLRMMAAQPDPITGEHPYKDIAMQDNPRTLPRNWHENQQRAKWMGPRMKAYIRQGASPRAAMRRAAADWRNHSGSRRNNPYPSMAIGGETVSNPTFAQGELVKVKTLGGEQGRVAGVTKGRTKSHFLGLWKSRDPDQVQVATLSGGTISSVPEKLARANPSVPMKLAALAILGLIAFGALERNK